MYIDRKQVRGVEVKIRLNEYEADLLQELAKGGQKAAVAHQLLVDRMNEMLAEQTPSALKQIHRAA